MTRHRQDQVWLGQDAVGRLDGSRALVLKEGKTPGPYVTIDAAHKAAAVTLNYGTFINTLLSFIIVAFSIFVVVKAINKLKREEAAAPVEPAPPTKQEELLTEIRDLLKAGKA